MNPYAALLLAAVLCGGASADTLKSIVGDSGVKGGLVVVLGCDDPGCLLGPQPGDAHLVQGLDTDPDAVSKAMATVEAAGTYGQVSVDLFDGRSLPYVDGLVNLIVVADGRSNVAPSEFARVLCPGGVLMIHGSELSVPAGLEARRVTLDGWRAAVRPVPPEIGEWTHFLGGPNNNAVSKDSVVGPVSGLKWTCGPLWSRSHEFTSSLSNLVSSGGRIFYIVDEGPTSITTPEMPERWVLIARDAFNGKQLWRMPLPEWRSRLGSRTNLRSVPPSAQRSLVADADRVFFASPMGAPVKALDAATGRVLATYQATEGAREFVAVAKSLVLYQEKADEKGRGRVSRVDTETGKLLWSAPNDRYKGESLAASTKAVVYHNGRTLVCLDFADGNRRWPAEQRQTPQQRKPPRPTQATYILLEDLVIEGGASQITARRTDSGKVAWQVKTGGKAMRGQDCFVARGCVWHAAGEQIVGYDLKTGKPTKTVDPSSVQSAGHHLRCHRAKATQNYLITQFRGVEFVSIAGKENSQTDWARGACSFGVVPANGLLYVPPNPCFCYPGVKIRGLNALATKRALDPSEGGRKTGRLERGPAFAARPDGRPTTANSDWPTYRHDPMRHGTTDCPVAENVAVKWQTDLGARLSPPVMACGRVYLAAKDRHAVLALDATTGETAWSFTSGGRVDSPPTIYSPKSSASGPLCIFGSTDGHVYCVTADEGRLVWKFRAAPNNRKILAFDRLESAWPVHGSVLLKNDVVYFAAGRSSMLDGGIWLFGLNPRTGEVLHETNVDTLSRIRHDFEGKPSIPSYIMDGGHADILVSQGNLIHMGPMMFDLKLNRLETPHAMDSEQTAVALDISKADYITMNAELERVGYETFRSFHKYQEQAWPEMTEAYKARFGGINLGDLKMGPHIAPTAGFLDDSWFNRTYWMYSDIWPGWYHAHRGAKTGQLLVVGRERTYAVQAFSERNRQSPLFSPGAKGYLLLADANETEPVLDFKTRGATKGLGFTRAVPPVWHDWVPIRVLAMVQAGDVLFLAGTPDVVPEDDPAAALDGRRGGVLRAVSALDGSILSQQQLDAPPVFDGLVAAEGSLFVCLENARVVCLVATSEKPSAQQQATLRQLRAEQASRHEQNKKEAESRTFQTAPAEPDLSTGKRLSTDAAMPRKTWRVVRASSVETSQPAFAPEKAFDGLPGTSWHSKWQGGRDPFPHEIVIDLGSQAVCRGIHYLPRQDRAQNGRIKQYALYIAKNTADWGEPAVKSAFKDTLNEQSVSFTLVTGQYLRLVVESGYDKDLTAIAELNILAK